MATDRWAATLPWPPSNNHLYTVARNRKILSAEGREYRDTATLACYAQGRPAKPLSGRLWVEVRVKAPDRRRRDLDNVAKAVLDVLTVAGVIEDDGLIDDLHIMRHEPVQGGCVEVVVRTL